MNAGLGVIVFGGVLMVVGAFVAELSGSEDKDKLAMLLVYMGSGFISAAALSMLAMWLVGGL